MSSIAPVSFSTTLAADKVLGLQKLASFTVDVADSLTLRLSLDMGVVRLPTGAAGNCEVRGAFYLLAAGAAAPTSGAAASYKHYTISIIRNATYDASWALGTSILDQSYSATVGNWEIWGAVIVEDVGTLNTASISVVTPSGTVSPLGVASGAEYSLFNQP